MSMIPEIPMAELKINSWNPIRTGFVFKQDTHVSITHLATQIYVEASDERSVHRAKAVAMEKFEKAWAEYWSKPTMNNRETMQKAFEARVKEQCAKNGANEAYINAVLCKDSLGNYINIGTWQRFDDFCDVWQAALAAQQQANIPDVGKMVQSQAQKPTSEQAEQAISLLKSLRGLCDVEDYPTLDGIIDAMQSQTQHESKAIGYVVWGISDGKHYKHAIKLLEDAPVYGWQSDNCNLGEFWSGNDLVYLSPAPDGDSNGSR